MYSVTQRIKAISQPRGGYIPPKSLNVCMYSDENTTYDTIEFTPSMSIIAGLVVDYMTRWKMGASKEEAFEISLLGAQIAMQEGLAYSLLCQITSLNHKSLTAACQLVGYDVCVRAGMAYFKPVTEIQPTRHETDMIKMCVERSIAFFDIQKPITKNGFTCEGGYTGVISSGDGDYLTEDTLWDFKTSKRPPTKDHTLQILIYYLLGIHSIHPEFQTIQKIGIYNPILNASYTISISEIADEIMQTVSRDVIGYIVSDNATEWRDARVPDKKCAHQQSLNILQTITGTYRDFDELPCGIYDISIDDYWGFYSQYTTGLRPKFSNINFVKLIKADKYKMFIAISDDGREYILNGGMKSKCKHSIEYYYDNIVQYGQATIQPFKLYFDTLYAMADELNSIAPDNKYAQAELKRQVQYTLARERMSNTESTMQSQIFACNQGFNDKDACQQFYDEHPDYIAQLQQKIGRMPIFNAHVEGYKIILTDQLEIILNPCNGALEVQYSLNNPFTNKPFEMEWYETIYDAVKRHDKAHSRLLRQHLLKHPQSILARPEFSEVKVLLPGDNIYEILPHYLDEPSKLMKIMKTQQRLYLGIITKWDDTYCHAIYSNQ